MLIEIYIIFLLFIAGLTLGMISVMYGIKGPLRNTNSVGYCSNCNNVLKWYELIPVVSFFVSQGKCNYCKTKFSLLYPILEMLSAILFCFSYIIYGFSYEMIIMLILTLLLVNIYVSDLKYFIILNKPLFIFSILVLLLKYIFFGFETLVISLCSGLLIFIFMYFIRYIGNKIFKEESIGGGDVKLAVFFGFLLGLRLSIISLILGSFLAFPYAIFSFLSNKSKEIPFGPFLITGLYLVFVFMNNINQFLEIIF